MMTEDCCAILDSALLTGWSAAKGLDTTAVIPIQIRIYTVYGTMKKIQYVKPSITRRFLQIYNLRGAYI